MSYKDPNKTREYNRAYQRRYRLTAKARATHRAWKNKPSVRARIAERKREFRSRQPAGFYRKQYLRAREIKYAVAGRPKPDACEICGTTKDRIVFDHCHTRGIFRGWICHRCNIVIGMAEDDVILLTKVIAYLKRTKNLIPPQLSLPGI